MGTGDVPGLLPEELRPNPLRLNAANPGAGGYALQVNVNETSPASSDVRAILDVPAATPTPFPAGAGANPTNSAAETASSMFPPPANQPSPAKSTSPPLLREGFQSLETGSQTGPGAVEASRQVDPRLSGSEIAPQSQSPTAIVGSVRPIGSSPVGDASSSGSPLAGVSDDPLDGMSIPNSPTYQDSSAPLTTLPAKAFEPNISSMDRELGVGTPGQGTGVPGQADMEGARTAQLVVEKVPPVDVQVGKPATFVIKVRNAGSVAAEGVEIHDEIPRGTQLMTTTPPASRGAGGTLVWDLGKIEPGGEVTAHMQVMPVQEGEIGSVATLVFRTRASARTMATKPELVVHTEAPQQVLAGEDVSLSVVVSNPGSGVARNAVLHATIPPGLSHREGSDLECEVGDLEPNQSQRVTLILRAEEPGTVTNVLTVQAEPNLRADDQVVLQVIAPELTVGLTGPDRRYLDRPATYALQVSNPGTASAQDVELVAHLSPGLEFVRANNTGQFVAKTRTVHWRLKELPAGETGNVELVALPSELGQQIVRISGTTAKGLNHQAEKSLLVEGIAALLSEVVDVADPIEVGGETSYEIKVLNQGSKAATNIQVIATIPVQMAPISGEGPTRWDIRGNQVIFEPLPSLSPKADTTYRVRVRGTQPGDLRVRVQLTSSELVTPVTEEESTRVYAD